MTLRKFYFESLGGLLDYIEATPRSKSGAYIPQGAGGSTKDHDTTFYGRPLAQMVADCRSMLPFAKDIAEVEALAMQLTPQLPPPRSVKRRRVRSDMGDNPDVDRMLAGDLAHAWVTTRKLLHDDPTALTTLILPTSYPGGTPQEVIFWTMAATLALAYLLEQSGRRTCLVSLEYSRLTTSPDSISTIVILKAHDSPWSLQEAIVTTDRAYLRRLFFRQRDCLPNPPDLGYGVSFGQRKLQAHIPACATEYGWRHWILGAHVGHDHIYDAATALAWMQNQLTALEAVAV